jgi:hypothetical protein
MAFFYEALARSACLPASWFGDSEANVIYKVSLRDITYPCGKREALIGGNAVSSLSTDCSSQNLLCVKAAFAYAAENAAAFCLDAQILACGGYFQGWRRLLSGIQPERR